MPLSDMSMHWTLFLSFCFLAAMGWAASVMMCCLVTRQSYKASCYGLESLKLWVTIYPSPLKQLILGILSHQQKADPHRCEHQGPPQCTLILEVSLWEQQHLTPVSISPWHVLCPGWDFGWATIRVPLSGSWPPHNLPTTSEPHCH